MIDIKQRGEWRGRVTNVHGPMGWHGPAYRIAASRRLLRAVLEVVNCFDVLLGFDHPFADGATLSQLLVNRTDLCRLIYMTIYISSYIYTYI